MRPEAIRALTLIEVRAAIAAGELTSEAVTLAAIEQARRFDRDYALFITPTYEQALEAARDADRRRAAGAPLGPLHGVPVTVKDNIDAAGVRTTAGARVLAGRVPTADATVVQKLTAAGAISLGKTNMHEMAMGGTTMNPHFGLTRNPWNPAHVPGGSSGGAGAVQALQIGYAALGTDSGGSVRMPASMCGLVGFKQTHGVVSLRGCVPTGNWSTDHIGPLTRTVADAALVFDIMRGYDPADPDSTPHQPEAHPPVASLQGLTVGLPEHYFWEGLDPDVERLCRAAVETLRQDGATVLPVHLETIDALAAASSVSRADGYLFHERYLQEHPEWYGEDIRYRLLATPYISAVDYVRAQRVRRLFITELRQALASVDVLALPTLTAPPPTIEACTAVRDGVRGPMAGPNTVTMVRNTFPANQSGTPAVSLPVGLTTSGLPVGLQLWAAAFADFTLLAIASRAERLLAFDPTPPVLRLEEVAA